MARRPLAFALLASALLTACNDDPAAPPPTTPPPGTAVFSTADDALLARAIAHGVFPDQDALLWSVRSTHLNAIRPDAVERCPLLTETGVRSYQLAGPCTDTDGTVY